MPIYSKTEIRSKIESGLVEIRGNASEDAYSDFGWEQEDIEKCLLKLRPSQCYDSQPHWHCPEASIDFYRAHNIMEGNDVFTHFYVHPTTGKLTINSFKEI
jgi:hypothetical protein